MKTLVLVLLVGCVDVPTVQIGDVNIEAHADGRVEANACSDCGGAGRDMHLHHAGTVTPMEYGGFIFANYHTQMAHYVEGEPFVITLSTPIGQPRRDPWQAAVTLPPAFTLEGGGGSVSASGTLALRWDGAGYPMRWDFTFPTGWGAGGDVDDDGSVEIDMADIVDTVDEYDACPNGCRIGLSLSRVVEGDFDRAFPAERITGVQVRSIGFTLVR